MSRNRQQQALAMHSMRRRIDAPSKKSSWIDRKIISKFLEAMENLPVKVTLWDGYQIQNFDQDPMAMIVFNNSAVVKQLMFNRDIGFGDGYTCGDIEIRGDLVDFLVELYAAAKRINKKHPTLSSMTRLLSRSARSNSLNQSKSNIHHHYDLGNDFYRLWLDEEMQYTCAYFPEPDMTIEQAQAAKMEHVCRKLQLKPGQTVVEAGCGWGGLAVYMARHYGVKVKSYNISHQQIAYAVERAKKLGLDEQVEYVEDDYRNIKGEYDVFVSVGMLEHVGKQHYSILGAVADRCLKPSGRALVHSIGRNVPELMNPWIEKRIFPGAYPPSIREMMDIIEPHDFSVLDIENLRLHYAETLEHWLQRFNANENVITDMFDENFVRAWRLYLAGSKAAFLESSLQLFQMVFARANDNSIPWSRVHQYVGTTQ